MKFTAKVSGNFKEEMIEFWYCQNGCTKSDTIGDLTADDFVKLCDRLSGKVCTFKSFTYFTHENGITEIKSTEDACLEVEDNVFAIPLSALSDFSIVEE